MENLTTKELVILAYKGLESEQKLLNERRATLEKMFNEIVEQEQKKVSAQQQEPNKEDLENIHTEE